MSQASITQFRRNVPWVSWGGEGVRWNWTDAYDGWIESLRQADEENVIGHVSLWAEALRLSLLHHEVLTTGPGSLQLDRCCLP